MRSMTRQPRTLYDKICDAHAVHRFDDGEHLLLYVDRHILNEYTSPQAFSGLRGAGRDVWNPKTCLAVIDHVNPTAAHRTLHIQDREAAAQVDYFRRNCADFGIELFDLLDPRQGIEHVVVPEQGLSLPGSVIVCGDSHTTTYGAFGALGFGVGTSEVEHVLATQTLVYRRLRNMRIRIDGALLPGITAKDIVLAVIRRTGASGAIGHAIEFTGTAIATLGAAGRMTLCNMAVEAGARGALIAPDEKVFAYLKTKPRAPKGTQWESALQAWRQLFTDDDAHFDAELTLDASEISPLVTWGTSPDQTVAIDGFVPDPVNELDPTRRRAMERSLAYMDLKPMTPIDTIRVDCAFIGSCTNGRIEDLRDAAAVVIGRAVAAGVRAIVVPGSGEVRRQAEAEGIDRIFITSGFEWRQAGCSMCLAMNDDALAPGERCASSTNRNFEGRQGRGGRTHLMSPAMVAAAAVTGHLCDVRKLLAKG
jgi:3-isopropylmalate/(R)-2-methylmalate dehydratase large subunit